VAAHKKPVSRLPSHERGHAEGSGGHRKPRSTFDDPNEAEDPQYVDGVEAIKYLSPDSSERIRPLNKIFK
jgi:hypothetical protein